MLVTIVGGNVFVSVWVRVGEGGERLRLRFGLIIVSTTFIVCGQVVKLTVAYKNSLNRLLLEISPAEEKCILFTKW